jgi:curli biogenesis system outer membrane secretion channel CsgG
MSAGVSSSKDNIWRFFLFKYHTNASKEGHMYRRIIALLVTLTVLATWGCMESMVKPEAKTDTGEAMGLSPYSGPKARVAVADFEWKVDGSGSTTTIGMGGQTIQISHSQQTGYTTGLRDMLTTAMVQTNRYRVLERQNLGSLQQEMALGSSGYTDQSGIKKGAIKGADLLVMGAVTGWEPGTSGGGGGLGGGGMLGKATAIFGAAKGAYSKSSMAMDIRIVDTATSEVLAATRVEGVAKDVNLGGFLGTLGGSGAMAGGLGGYAKTPMEKAIRTCLYNATRYITDNTPQQYMKH